jgi:hypothetical protein
MNFTLLLKVATFNTINIIVKNNNSIHIEVIEGLPAANAEDVIVKNDIIVRNCMSFYYTQQVFNFQFSIFNFDFKSYRVIGFSQHKSL